MKKLFTFIMILLLVFGFTGCSIIPNKTNVKKNQVVTPVREKKNKDEEKEVEEKEEKEWSKNITHEEEQIENGKLVLFAENKNDIAVNLFVTVEFYEKDELKVTDKESLYGVGAKNKIAVSIYDTPDTYDSYKVSIEAKDEKSYKCYTDKLEVIDSEEDDKVVIQATNKSEAIIDYVSISVVYYKDGKAVGLSTGFDSTIKPDKTANFNIYPAYTKDYEYVEYDTYKVFINQVYSYTFDY